MSVPVTLVPPPPSIPTDQVYTCTYTVITRGSQPLKRSIIYAGRVTAHWPAYSPVEKRLPRKVKLNERQTSPRREEKRREPPIPVHALPSPFHLSGASKRSRDDSRDDPRVRSFRSVLPSAFCTNLRSKSILTRSKNDGPITRRLS